MIKKKLKQWFKNREQSLMWDRNSDSIYTNIFGPTSEKMTK